ncbi:DNA internalization-related competence protein ComEC/Rec2 [Bacillus sp. AGMB 02131]|uniref:DNA internalization-related competence protein ComEC/Rec2 n=1 Tax=Peribacillus faecalis TaxID=2772559 RepID=A0A927CYC7_9BACI|nr:DNA internalization-related competence protein ComEC/Rec2 [Peribacillus faecalis]MBD3109983.1 DNA internalization-related competence protein ComEC/Rec2 [Peribacillus faecalis]
MIVMMAVAAMLGIGAYYYPLPALICIIILFVFLYFMRTERKHVFLIFFCIFFYYFTAFIQSDIKKSKLSGEEQIFTIRFSEDYEINGASLQTFVNTADGEKLLLRYIFRTEKEKKQFIDNYQLGSTCRLKGKLEKPSAARNENSFDYRLYLHNLHVHWLLKSTHNPHETCIHTKLSLSERIKTFRLNGLLHLDQRFPEEAKAFAAALLFGESGWIDDDTYDAYKKLSLVHILAISGMHVGIISGAFFYLGIRLGMTREMTKIALIALLPVYCLIAGGAPSVVRACLMVMLVLLLSLCKRKLSPVIIVCIVFMLLLLYNPLYLFHVGFQLSFFITFALLMSVKLLQYFQTSNIIIQSLAVTILCQLCSMPFILFYFYEFSLWGFMLNVIYIPIYTFILMPLTFVVFFLSVIQAPFSSSLISALEFAFTFVNKIAVSVSNLPLTSVSLGKPSFWFFLLLIALTIANFSFFEQGQRKKSMLALIACVLALVLFYHQEYFSFKGEIVFIDVGQGDSILIKLQYGRGTYLIDTGGVMHFEREEWQERKSMYDPGEKIVVPYLKSIGITSIDKLIITHDDADHMGGGLAVLQHLAVKEIVIAETLKEEFIETDFIAYARHNKIPVTAMKAGDGWKIGDSRFFILHPHEKMSDSNENSLVLLAEINGLKWLFTGDIGEEGELTLMKQYPNLKADVLKVGHHGSKTSSSPAFLDHIEAKVAVISAGYNNRFGHPHADVLSALSERNMRVYRTDEQGAIAYSYFGGKGTFSVQLP